MDTTTSLTIPNGYIMGMGNPLLDMTVSSSNSHLDKHDLKRNTAILAEPKHYDLFDEITNGEFEVRYVAGGATQNSIRIAQWMGRSPGATTFLGSIGKDNNGAKLIEVCLNGGVKPMYYESEDRPTGACAVLVTGNERTMVTKLEAANDYKHAHTLKLSVQNAIDKAMIFYSAGFFLTVPDGPESMMSLAKHACENNKLFCLNLSAEFLIHFFSEPIKAALPYVDYLFSNEQEAACFGKTLEWGTDLPTIALKLSQLPKENSLRERIVVITSGSDPTIVASSGKVTTHPVPLLADDRIVDTCGAGDAFVGGFIARLAVGIPIEECVKAGHYAASVVIQNVGCTVSGSPDK